MKKLIKIITIILLITSFFGNCIDSMDLTKIGRRQRSSFVKGRGKKSSTVANKSSMRTVQNQNRTANNLSEEEQLRLAIEQSLLDNQTNYIDRNNLTEEHLINIAMQESLENSVQPRIGQINENYSLKNLTGSICYQNSVFQVLTNCKSFIEVLALRNGRKRIIDLGKNSSVEQKFFNFTQSLREGYSKPIHQDLVNSFIGEIFGKYAHRQ